MIAAFIQARMTSSRLPGKVLKTIMERPMLELQIERVKACETIDKIVVVTSISSEDQAVVEFCKQLAVDVFCGNLENVLDRFYQAARQYKPDYIVRLTGDCPLIDPTVIDALIRLFFKKKGDYGTNCMPPTFPDGLDAEIFSTHNLMIAWQEATLPSHLEHISLFFETQPERFKITNLANHTNLSDLRWTVDEPEDFEFAARVFETLYPLKPLFGMDDIVALLTERPDLVELNRRFERNEGLIKSIADDKAYMENTGKGGTQV